MTTQSGKLTAAEVRTACRKIAAQAMGVNVYSFDDFASMIAAKVGRQALTVKR